MCDRGLHSESMLGRASRRRISSLTSALKKNAFVDIHPEVAEALHARKPVVALESTIITHGMPYPINLETARSVERNVRASGSIPATIGLIEGRVKIGLEPYELERLAECKNDPAKLSRRDIGAAIALKRDGGTTCSATLVFAALAGIKVPPNSVLFDGFGSDLPLGLRDGRVRYLLRSRRIYSTKPSYVLSMGGVHRAGQDSKLFVCAS